MSHRAVEMEEARSLSSVHLLPYDEHSPRATSGEHLIVQSSDQEDLPPASASSDRRRLASSSPGTRGVGAGGRSMEDEIAARNKQQREKLCRVGICIIVGAIALVLIVAIAVDLRSSNTPQGSKYDSVDTCLKANRPPNMSAKQPDWTRPSQPSVTIAPVLFTHANIWTGVGPLLTDADLLIENGKITSVSSASGQRLPAPSAPNLVKYDSTGRWITPGIVDLHSHAGVGAWPGDLWATDDINEMTNPTFPQLRAVDALDPLDPAFPLILAGGVTTSQIMPGSGDAMGGEGVLVKNRGRTVQDMILKDGPRLMKMACGENVKRVFGRGKGVTPMSRLGSAWVMRERFERAQNLKNRQDDWCNSSEDYQNANRFPNERESESLAALLRGEIRLNTHCYLTQDFEMMLRLMAEFNFNVTTFHHALSAWRIADVLAFNSISVATFADLGLYKHEAYDASTLAPSILKANGVNTILKTDHPVTFSGALGWEAAKAHHYGLDAQSAIAAVTSAPAKAAGIDDHIGSLQAGYDADVVVWDRDPLVLGARTVQVYVDGQLLVDRAQPIYSGPDSSVVNPDMTAEGPVQVCGLYNNTFDLLNDVPHVVELACYAIVGVTIYQPAPLTNANMVVRDGLIACIGDATTCPVPTTTPACTIFRLTTGVLMPGLIESGSHIGQYDISSEDVTGDGSFDGSSASGEFGVISTLDGLRFKARHTRAVWAAGIGNVISRPVASQLIAGQSAAFRTCCGQTMFGNDVADPIILQDSTAFHVVIGNAAKNGGSSAAISGQLSVLRGMFEEAAALNKTGNVTSLSRTAPTTPFVRVLQGSLPFVAEVHHADEILAVVRLQQSFGFQLTILGAAEVALVADVLASTTPKTQVIYFSRPLPMTMETLRVRSDTLAVLKAKGILFAISTGDTDNARNLRWEAGWNMDTAALTEEETVRAVTSNVATIFNLPAGTGQLIVDKRAEFALFNGSPFSLQTTVQLVGTGDQVDCRPKQR